MYRVDHLIVDRRFLRPRLGAGNTIVRLRDRGLGFAVKRVEST